MAHNVCLDPHAQALQAIQGMPIPQVKIEAELLRTEAAPMAKSIPIASVKAEVNTELDFAHHFCLDFAPLESAKRQCYQTSYPEVKAEAHTYAQPQDESLLDYALQMMEANMDSSSCPATGTGQGAGAPVVDSSAASGSDATGTVEYGELTRHNHVRSLVLKRLKLGKHTHGGAMLNSGELIGEDLECSHNRAVNGGCLYNAGSLRVTRAKLFDNRASNCGGGVYIEQPRSGVVTIAHTHFDSNHDHCGH